MTSRPASPLCPACAGQYPDATDDPNLICQCGTHWQAPSLENTMPIIDRDTRDARIIELYQDDDTPVKDIAAQFKLTTARISQIAAAAEIPLRRPQNRPKNIAVSQVIIDHEAGLTVAEIAANHHVSDSTIRRYLKQRGLRANPPVRRSRPPASPIAA
ncbi:hypothetical protein ACIBHY_29980 [Nonomuraea sp. NPDC050547]|uniref:hypothetical protein n=1 Tax=Nonomuraea sp. NPDC050547 TaxID=3364368 RepID=UPI0037B87191